MSEDQSPRTARTIQRILSSASRIFGRSGFRGASMGAVAEEAGVSKGLLHYHFRSKEHLLIEAQRATFRQIHKRFAERTSRGEVGLGPALSAFDAMWQSLRDLRVAAPFIVETLSLTSQEGPISRKLDAFYKESTALLEDGIQKVFTEELDHLTVPPERMAVLIRICLEGLTVELAQCRTDADLAVVDQAYADIRELFQRFVLARTDPPELDPDALAAVPLPW
jgi:AcrR family transcriptional regulator